MYVEKWFREMSFISEIDAFIKQAFAYGLLLYLKNIYFVFFELLVMLLFFVLDVKIYRDDARLNEWIFNRVQELGDRYYFVNKYVKIRYIFQFRKGFICKLLFYLRVNRNVGNYFICIFVC